MAGHSLGLGGVLTGCCDHASPSARERVCEGPVSHGFRLLREVLIARERAPDPPPSSLIGWASLKKSVGRMTLPVLFFSLWRAGWIIFLAQLNHNTKQLLNLRQSMSIPCKLWQGSGLIQMGYLMYQQVDTSFNRDYQSCILSVEHFKCESRFLNHFYCSSRLSKTIRLGATIKHILAFLQEQKIGNTIQPNIKVDDCSTVCFAVLLCVTRQQKTVWVRVRINWENLTNVFHFINYTLVQ